MTNIKVFVIAASVFIIAAYLIPASIGAFTLLSIHAYDPTTWHYVFRLNLGIVWTGCVWYAAWLAWGKK